MSFIHKLVIFKYQDIQFDIIVELVDENSAQWTKVIFWLVLCLNE
jgi:hypothetical protein